MPFTKRRINVTFSLGQGDFGEGGFTDVKLENLWIDAKILFAGGVSMSFANVMIWGMTLEQMNKLSTLGMQVIAYRRNKITVTAGDDVNGDSVVFKDGTIVNAWMDGNNPPDVVFHVEAQMGLIDAVKPAQPSSYSGSTDAGTVAQDLASKMGYQFENNGVSVKLHDPYFFGSARNQLISLAKAARFEWIIYNGALPIWPIGGSRSGSGTLVAPETGMRAYPTFDSKGVLARREFSRPARFGAPMTIRSSVTPANGEWVIYRQDLSLSTLPKGDWFESLYGVRQGLGPVIP